MTDDTNTHTGGCPNCGGCSGSLYRGGSLIGTGAAHEDKRIVVHHVTGQFVCWCDEHRNYWTIYSDVTLRRGAAPTDDANQARAEREFELHGFRDRAEAGEQMFKDLGLADYEDVTAIVSGQ